MLSTKSYTYRSSGWTDQLIGYNGESISYDAIGNPTSYLGHSLSWSNVRRLSGYDGNTFSYNASGIRTKKNNITYTLDGSRILREDRSEGTLNYYYGVEGLTGFRYNGVDYYYRKNLQGDIIGIINAVGTELVSYSYDAWGNILWTEDDSGRNLAELNPFRYRGYYYDTETGLYYLNSRYYDPRTGRFINADAVDYLGEDAEFSCNLYAYCANNPVNRIDEEGTWAQWITKAIAVAAVALTVVAATAITVATFGAGSVAGVAMITATLTLAAKATEVVALQTKKSRNEGKDWGQTAIDSIESVYNNGGKIIGITPFSKVGSIAAMHLLNKEVAKIFGETTVHRKTLSAAGGKLVGYGFAAYAWGNTIFSIFSEDPEKRASQRGYILK